MKEKLPDFKVYPDVYEYIGNLRKYHERQNKLKQLFSDGIKGWANAKTRNVIASIREAMTSRCFSFDLACVSCLTSFKKRTLLK